MIEKRVDQEGVILFVKSNPVVQLEDMLNGLDYLQKNSDLPKDLRILEDATNVKVAFVISDIDILIKKMHKVIQKYNTIRHAVIHDSPENTAYAMLIHANKISDDYMLRIFSTRKEALLWLNIN